MIRFVIFSCLLVLASCGEEIPSDTTEQKKEINSTNPIDGSWIIRRGVGPYADRQIGQVFSFKGNKFQFNKDALAFTGDVTYGENSFTITPHKNPNAKTFNYQMVGDTMVMTMEGSQLTFYLVRIITN